jgi:hypothetical protein
MTTFPTNFSPKNRNLETSCTEISQPSEERAFSKASWFYVAGQICSFISFPFSFITLLFDSYASRQENENRGGSDDLKNDFALTRNDVLLQDSQDNGSRCIGQNASQNNKLFLASLCREEKSSAKKISIGFPFQTPYPYFNPLFPNQSEGAKKTFVLFPTSLFNSHPSRRELSPGKKREETTHSAPQSLSVPCAPPFQGSFSAPMLNGDSQGEERVASSVPLDPSLDEKKRSPLTSSHTTAEETQVQLKKPPGSVTAEMLAHPLFRKRLQSVASKVEENESTTSASSVQSSNHSPKPGRQLQEGPLLAFSKAIASHPILLKHSTSSSDQIEKGVSAVPTGALPPRRPSAATPRNGQNLSAQPALSLNNEILNHPLLRKKSVSAASSEGSSIQPAADSAANSPIPRAESPLSSMKRELPRPKASEESKEESAKQSRNAPLEDGKSSLSQAGTKQANPTKADQSLSSISFQDELLKTRARILEKSAEKHAKKTGN